MDIGETRKKRNINIELLRILSMLLIVYHHYSVHSSWIFHNSFSKRTALINIIGNFGKIGVIIFVLITGYFILSKDLVLKKFSSYQQLQDGILFQLL